jgi:TrmH family RNA methyltransferase
VADLPELDRLRVVLVTTRNPLNIGAAARAMSNFGFHRLRVVNPYDPAYREARSAVGASEVLAEAEEFTSVADAIGDCMLVVGTTSGRDRELQQPLRNLKQGAALIRRELGRGRVALLFGSEKRGLSNQELSHCHWLLHIPTRKQHPAMNLGQAVAVCLYEIARDARPVAPPRKPTAANSAQTERVTTLLSETLCASGYFKASSANQQKVRRLVRRFNLSAVDAELWLGMLRQMLWKMGQEK